MTVPDWVADAIFYQIFPDRFANGDPDNDPVNVKPWGSPPTAHGFMGGDLQGIIQKLDYLSDLGINAIYLNPIFLSSSTHRYNTTDYYRIDPRLGTKEDFDALVKTAHQKNIRVILDGVFNHCGRGFFAFSDVLENQENSPYKDWFYIQKFPIDAYSPGDARDYLGWWKHKSLPKLKVSNPEVRSFLLDVSKYWIREGADGWRLDVPNEIDDDEFWAEFREGIRGTNGDAYLLGEIWEPSPRWVGDTHFDGLMNYPLRTALIDLIEGKIHPPQFMERVDNLLNLYPLENLYAMYSLLGSHDTERILTLFQGNLEKCKLAYLFIYAFPGCPAIYYGDEVGIEGGKDPDSRRAFPWDESQWNSGLREYIKNLIKLRTQSDVLRRGEFRFLSFESERNFIGFTRSKGDEKILVLLNPTNSAISINILKDKIALPEGYILRDMLGSGDFQVIQNSLTFSLPAYSGLLLK